MTEFTIYDETNAPAESKANLKAVKSRYGFIPNIMGELAISPTALEAYTSLASVFGQSSLTSVEQQVVSLTTSYENNCTYCVAAHSTIALSIGMSRDVLLAIREGRVIESDIRLEALHKFTTAVVRERGLAEKVDIEDFLKAGYTKANVLDVITGVTMKTLSNYSNHIAETELDTAFQAMAWTKPLLQPAQ
jgi:uncharacterized peroxidase-related enzyme